MGFLKRVFNLLKNKFQAPEGKKHPFDEKLKAFLSKTNMTAPPLDKPTAFKILNIEQKEKEIEARLILERYYTLYKKNDPSVGGTSYIQSKIIAAKEMALTDLPDAKQAEQLFMKEVVEPDRQAEEQKKQKEKEEKEEEEKKKGESKAEPQDTQKQQKQKK